VFINLLFLTDSDFDVCFKQRQCFRDIKQHAGCVVKKGTKAGECVHLTPTDCNEMHIGKQTAIESTKVCTTGLRQQYPTLCHAVSVENTELSVATAIMKKNVLCPSMFTGFHSWQPHTYIHMIEHELISDVTPTGEIERWTYGIYRQNLSDGTFCNYAARAKWTYMHHLSVLMVNQMQQVPFCFICSTPGELIHVWYSEDSMTRVGTRKFHGKIICNNLQST